MQNRKNVKFYKMKSHKGLSKRIKIEGGTRNIMFRFKAPGARHLMRNKSNRNKRFKKKVRYLTGKGDIKRAKKLLPYFKRKKYHSIN